MISRYAFSKLIALVVGLICLLIAYNFNSNNIFKISGSAYGTSWSVSSTEFIADHHEKNILSIINDIDMIASNYKVDSEIAFVNKKQIKTNIVISDDLFKILSIAKEVSLKTQNYYDITLGKISTSMGFSPNFDIDTSSYNLIRTFTLDSVNQTVSKSSDFWFDLSSIAKGYAVQKIHEYLIENNLSNHLIDIGGEIIIHGLKYEEPWKVGIQNPSSTNLNAVYVIENKNGSYLSLATSGEYRNLIIKEDGSKVTHTINPKTLKSIKLDAISISVLDNKSATYSDAYATAFNAMDSKLALEVANKNSIPLMLISILDNELVYTYSDKWYDFNNE